jgi:hypothetical protein
VRGTCSKYSLATITPLEVVSSEYSPSGKVAAEAAPKRVRAAAKAATGRVRWQLI